MDDDVRPVWWTDEVERRHLRSVRPSDTTSDNNPKGWRIGGDKCHVSYNKTAHSLVVQAFGWRVSCVRVGR